jgi:hypothetical protein
MTDKLAAINSVLRRFLDYADGKPYDVEIQRIAEEARALLKDLDLPVTTLEELNKAHGEKE